MTPDSTAARITDTYRGFLAAWKRHEAARRDVCPECQFESSEGYEPSHAPGCSQEARGTVG